MNNQADGNAEIDSGAGHHRQQHETASAMEQPAIAITAQDVDALAREIHDLPRVEKFGAKAQLARLGPALATMKKKGYDLAAIRGWLSAHGVHASISSISRAINGHAGAKAKRKKPEIVQ